MIRIAMPQVSRYPGKKMAACILALEEAGVITILLVDDHNIIRKGIRMFLEGVPDFVIVGEAENGQEAINQVLEKHPAVLVSDFHMPGMNGVQMTRQLARAHPETRVLILSMYSDMAYVQAALQAGALGYVLKDASGGDLIEAIRAVSDGRRYLSSPLAGKTDVGI